MRNEVKSDFESEISEILETLGEHLDVSKTQYESAVKSYEAVGAYLSRENSPIYNYEPRIIPQGSFMLGTIIKSIHEEDDIDIDLVLQLSGKGSSWTQEDLKTLIGDDLKDNGTYRPMIKNKLGGRRCWTLEYSDSANYHMDILPAIVEGGYVKMLSEGFRDIQHIDVDRMAIRITDKLLLNFSTEPDTRFWLKSNPLGYAQWFFGRALYSEKKMFTLNEAVDPVRNYSTKKSPLQRAVQLLKRHRDIMFSSSEFDSEDKPISIIITTLAAHSYNRSSDLIETMIQIVSQMRNHIEVRFNESKGRYEKWVENPVNPAENFADKWPDNPRKEEYFYLWLRRLEQDILEIKESKGKGLPFLNESLSRQFGRDIARKTFSSFGAKHVEKRDEGDLKMAKKTGRLGGMGIPVIPHNFEGNV